MMTLWEDIVGYTCWDCGKWATHWYGDIPICCECHMKGDDSTYETSPPDGYVDSMQAEAIKVNTLFQKGLPLYDTSTP